VSYFLEYAGPGIIRTDRITTQIYTGLGFFTLFLVGFGVARRRSASVIAVGVVAAVYGAWQPALDVTGFIVSPAASVRMSSWALHLADYSFTGFDMVSWLLVLTLVVAVVLRQLAESRRQAHLEQEMRSAQEIQHILIPEEIPSVPGMTVASVYKPAAEVGGDFFQVIPSDTNGSDAGTLILAGDVSGKGLRAAMTVSLVVGALRTLAESDSSPAAVLAGLNRRLLGRTQGGFVTCCAVRIDAGGRATMANAGHCQPYLDGREIDLPNGLPLGLVADVEYEEVSIDVAHGQRITLLSDGVVEARNAHGELYGFDRLNHLMQNRPSAEHIADTAVSFGQDDDITVLTVTRQAAA
jgi:serine phosphatase RsbU (regulator of sigma subunit)